MRPVPTCAVMLWVAGSLMAGAANAASDTNLLIKATELTPELVLAVAKVGEEKVVPVKAGTDILAIISRYCGTANVRRYYLPLFIAANANNPDIAAKRTVLGAETQLKLPACLYADEKLAAVTVASDGPNWSLPQSIDVSSLAQKITATTGSGDGQLRLAPHRPGSGTLAEAATPPSASAGPDKQVPGRDAAIEFKGMSGQAVDFSRLVNPKAALPDTLATAGPGIVIASFDSNRLEDPGLKAQYDKLVDKTLSTAKTSAVEDKPNPDIALRSSVFERAVRTQDILASNTRIDFARLQVNAKIVTSNFAPGPYAITVKPGLDPGEAAAAVGAASRPDAAVKVEQMGDYAPDFGEMGSTETNPGCAVAEGKKWPYDFDELRQVLEFRKRIGQPAQAGKILVLDTGFPPEQIDTPPFSKRYFVSDGDASDVHSYVRTGVPYQYFFSKAKVGSHGVAVLTLALGGVEAMKSRVLLDLVRSNNGQVVSLMGYKPRGNDGTDLDVNGEWVGPSLYGSNWAPTNVTGVNLSMRFNAPKNEFSTYFGENNQVVYVFSAGNRTDPIDLMLSRDQPAVLGGPMAANVITVGGLTPQDEYWPRSNFGTKFVDIAAPGCAVPTYVWNADTRQFDTASLSGTSFAAPIVSFAANLIRSDGSPGYKIKTRIVGSARHIAALDRKVNEGRALDLPVAAAIDFDAVRMRDGSLRLGSIDWGAGKPICGKMLKRLDVVQIQRLEKDRNTLVLALRRDRWLDFPSCQMRSEYLKDLSFRPLEPEGTGAKFGTAKPLDFEDVRSITLCEACYQGQ